MFKQQQASYHTHEDKVYTQQQGKDHKREAYNGMYIGKRGHTEHMRGHQIQGWMPNGSIWFPFQ